jgi:transposase
LIKWIDETAPANRKLIQDYIKETFDVAYEISSISKLLKRHGIKRMKPKLTPGSPRAEKVQLAFVNAYFKIRAWALKDPGIIQLFVDGAHLIHQVIPSYYWGIKGSPKTFQSNSSRNRLNILGAYDVQASRLTHLTSEKSCNAERVIEFLELIERTYKDKHSVIIYLDNAPYFHAAVVKEWLSQHQSIILSPLPSYSPNLNLIERLWRFVKEKLVRNRYYQQYKSFRAKTFQLLNHVNDFEPELKTLITENFEIIRQN